MYRIYPVKAWANKHDSARTFAKGISREDRDEGFARLDIYEKWFNEVILTGKHSNALIVMPLESMCPRYRDEPPSYVSREFEVATDFQADAIFLTDSGGHHKMVSMHSVWHRS